MSSELNTFLKRYSFSRINSASVLEIMEYITCLEKLAASTTDGNVRSTVATLRKCPIGQLAGRVAYLSSYLDSHSKKYSKGKKK